MSLLEAEKAHWASLKVHGIEVTYRNIAGSDIPITLVPANDSTRLVTDEGAVETHTQEQWLGSVEEMATAGIFPPKRGEYVTYTDGASNVRRFELMPGVGDKTYTAFGNYGVMIRIHSKEIVNA